MLSDDTEIFQEASVLTLLVKLNLSACEVAMLKHRVSKRSIICPVTLFKKTGFYTFETCKSDDTVSVQTCKEKGNYRQCHSVS
jgi:hypothetical protein